MQLGSYYHDDWLLQSYSNSIIRKDITQGLTAVMILANSGMTGTTGLFYL